MSVFKLANEHPLTNAGLHCIYVVQRAELGLRPGDIVFEFPFMTVHKEATAARTACNEHRQEVKRINVLPFSRAG